MAVINKAEFKANKIWADLNPGCQVVSMFNAKDDRIVTRRATPDYQTPDGWQTIETPETSRASRTRRMNMNGEKWITLEWE